MNRTYLLLGLILFFCACSDDDNPTIPIPDIILGQVETIAKGTGNVSGFALVLNTPNGERYEATIAESSRLEDFVVGNSVALKGQRAGSLLEVTKIISTDNDKFITRGNVISITENQGGYQAEILGLDEETYFAEVSISNLGNGYTDFSVGEIREVKGELWKSASDQKLLLTVKEIIE